MAKEEKEDKTKLSLGFWGNLKMLDLPPVLIVYHKNELDQWAIRDVTLQLTEPRHWSSLPFFHEKLRLMLELPEEPANKKDKKKKQEVTHFG